MTNQQGIQISGFFQDDKAVIEALTDVRRGTLAISTDTLEIGFYNGTVWVWSGDGAVGDMLKSIYDTDLDDVVDNALLWNGRPIDPSTPSDGQVIYWDDGDSQFKTRSHVRHSGSAPAAGDLVQYADTSGNVIEKAAHSITSLISSVLASAAALFAPIANGVTNGDSHDHSGGDGAQIAHGGLSGLSSDDHPQYIKHNLAANIGDFLIASGAGVFTKQSLAQTVTVLATPFNSIYAAITKGVTNGDSHDHTGGDGATLKTSNTLYAHGQNGVIAAGGNRFTPFFTMGLQTQGFNVQLKHPGVLKNLSVQLNSPQPASGGSTSLQVIVQINNVDSAFILNIPQGSATAEYTLAGNLSVSAGNLVVIKIVNNASANSGFIGAVSLEHEFSVYP